MATRRPLMCPNCGAQVKKNGYCSACYMDIRVLKRAYNTSDYHYNIGYDKAIARDLTGAIESLNMSLRYNKKNVMARNLIGLIYYEMGEVVMALSHWVMSVNYQSSHNLATKYLQELKQDVTLLESVDQIAKKFNMALAYAESEDYDLAILQLKNAIAINQHFIKGYLLLALLYIRVNNYEKARTTLRRILKIDKANAQAIHYLHEMGDTDENIIQMQKESVENDGLLEDEYIEMAAAKETAKTDSGIKHLFNVIAERYKESTIQTGEFGEMHFAKYSGIYVLVGLALGVLLLFFVIVPSQKKELLLQNEELVKSYSEELANKNASIATLNGQISDLEAQIEDMKHTEKVLANPVPDYSEVSSGMSLDDFSNLVNYE